MTIKPWKKLEEEVVYSNYRTILARNFIMPDGRQEIFEVNSGPDPVYILPFTVDKKILLIREFSPGLEQVKMGLAAGLINKGEMPLEAAARELKEETGYSGSLRSLGSIPLGKYSTINQHCFVAKNCKIVGNQQLDQNEFIEVIEILLPKFLKLLRAGQCREHGPAYFMLHNLNLL